MNRRGFLTGMAGILAAGYSASVLPSGVIMPVKKLWTPLELVPDTFIERYGVIHYFTGSVIAWNGYISSVEIDADGNAKFNTVMIGKAA